MPDLIDLKLRSIIPTPEQAIQAENAKLEVAIRRDALAKEQRATADTAGINDAYRQAFETRSDGVTTLNRDFLAQHLAQRNLGSHLPAVLKSLDDLDEAAAKALKTQREAQKDANDLIGSAAASIKGANYSPEVFGATLTQLAINKLIPEGQARAYLSRAQQDPAQVRAITDQWLAASPTQQERATAAQTAATGARRLDLEAPKMTADATVASQVAAGTVGGLTPEQQATNAARTATEARETTQGAARIGLERQRVGLEGQRVGLERQRLGAETMSPAGQAVPDVAPGQKNDAFLAALPGPQANLVKALAEGRQQFPGGSALRAPYWQNMLNAVAKYDPSFDAVNYNARSKTRAAFSSGKEAGQVNALNTVIGHLDGLSQAADALQNSNSPLYNSIANRLSKAVGKPQVTNFDTIKKAVADEVTKVWRQTGGTEADIQAAQANLDAANSPAQLSGAIATYGELLESKLGALKDQYRQGMGTDPIDMVTPQARATLTKLEAKAGKTPAAAKEGPAKPTVTPGKTIGEVKTYPNGRKAVWDGQGWAAQ